MLLRAIVMGIVVLARAALAADCPPPARPFTPELFQQAQAGARDRGLLWSVSKDGRTSYLYGTLHLGRAEWMAPGPQLQRALGQAELLALELDVLDEGVQRRMLAGFAKVRRVVPPALQERLKAAWLAQCLPPEALASGPVDLHLMTLGFASARREGINPEYASEVLLAVLARAAGREVVSLETPEDQLDALLSMSDAEVLVSLRDGLDDLAAGRTAASLRRTVDLWERGDLAALERLEQWCECMDTPAERRLMKRLLDDRNPGLADAVDQLHQRGRRVLAAVGALHMAGPGGLPARLAARGYEVRRLH